MGKWIRSTALFWVLACSGVQAQVLRFAAIPEEPQAVVQQRFEPLMRYLEARGLTAVWVPMPDMPTFIDAITSKRVDFAWTNGFSYLLSRQRMSGNLIPIAQRAEDAQYKSVFITADPAVKTFADLAGKSVLFGPASSASGHLMARSALLAQEPVAADSLKTAKHAASHESVMWRVAAQPESLVGALNESVWNRMVESGKLPHANLRAFHTTQPFPDYCFAIPADRDPALITALQNALIGLDPRRPDHQPILRALRATRVIIVNEESYSALENAAIQAGFIRK